MYGHRQITLSAMIVIAAAVAAAVAQLLNGDGLTAALGGALVLVYAGLERLFTVLGRRGSFHHGMLVGLSGSLIRMVVVLGCLVAVGLLDRSGFAACAGGFLAAFTVYLAGSAAMPVTQAGR